MHYLIDGHNLIARMPDISLADPDDEVQLILRLRGWTARSQKQQVTLFFDGGIPGGKNVKLSTTPVQVIFASTGQTADSLIRSAIQKVQNPSEFVLVSSDQQIVAAAMARNMKHMRSDRFAQYLSRQWQDTLPGPTISDEKPVLSEAEVAEWLALFGPVDDKALRRRPKPIPPNLPPEPEPEPEPDKSKPVVYNREEPQLSEKDLADWLALFGGEKKPEKEEEGKRPSPAPTTSARPKRARAKTSNPHKLRPDDLAAWQNFINQED